MRLTTSDRQSDKLTGDPIVFDEAQVIVGPSGSPEQPIDPIKRSAGILRRMGKRLIDWYDRTGLSNYVPTVRME